jgi:hypothetical protein
MRHLLIMTCLAATFVACDSKPKTDPKPAPVAAAKPSAAPAARGQVAKTEAKPTAKADQPTPKPAEPAAPVKPAAAPVVSAPAGPVTAALMDPSKATLKAPDTYKAKFTTTKGEIVIEVTRSWAPLGADRFFNLVKAGFFQDIALFRVIPGFMGQFGIHGNPKVSAAWKSTKIKDDPVVRSSV